MKIKKNKECLKIKMLKKLQIIIIKRLLIRLSGKIQISKNNNMDKLRIKTIKNDKCFESFSFIVVQKI